MPLDESTRGRIQELIGSKKVLLFMKGSRSFPQCGFSSTVVQILDSMGVEYGTFNVLSDPDVREGIKEFASWPTIPQLYVNGEFLGGCDIVREMSQSGELQGVLGVSPEAPSAEPPGIHITEAAAKVLEAASRDNGGDPVHLRISPRFENDLALGPPEPGELEAKVTGSSLKIYVDPASARRADGLRIDHVQEGGAGGFKLENPNAPAEVKAMTPKQLDEHMKKGTELHLYDVRTEAERQTARLESATHYTETAMQDVRALPKNAFIVFHCHHGGRSRQAAQRLVSDGFTNVHNLEGGIDAWSQDVDSSVPRY